MPKRHVQHASAVEIDGKDLRPMIEHFSAMRAPWLHFDQNASGPTEFVGRSVE